MKIAHQLTVDDLATCNSMMLVAWPPAKSRSVAGLAAVYGVGGGLLFGYSFDLSFWAFMALWGYVLGLVWLIVLALKIAGAKQIRQMARPQQSRGLRSASAVRSFTYQRVHLCSCLSAPDFVAISSKLCAQKFRKADAALFARLLC
jgi:hypothetical protein